MSKPYFSVGEDVTLVGINYPEFNGDAEVLEVRNLDSCATNVGCKYGYVLTTPSPKQNTSSARYSWCQCGLRKKQEPGEDWETFREKLNEPITES